jgi:cyclopropane-fatty-acyl-phospholipid synthase
MTSTNVLSDIQKYIPIMGDMAGKSPIAYKATRLMAGAFNATQMALAEAYINGLEIHINADFISTCAKSTGSL